MKIDYAYLKLIKIGNKKHEYRLNFGKNKTICEGDSIVLISNSNPNDYISVRVTNITKCSSWYDALKNHWAGDFKGLYNSLDETISFCSKFYKKEDISHYGLLRFDIEYNEFSITREKVLLSNDIVNQNQKYCNAPVDIKSLYNWLKIFECQKYIYDDNNGNAVDISKCSESYNRLKVNNEYSELFNNIFKSNIYKLKEMDESEKLMLSQVFCGQVDYYITNDNNVVENAKYLYLKDKVLTVR